MAGINDILPHIKQAPSMAYTGNEQVRDQHGHDLEAGQMPEFQTAAGQDMQQFFDKTREIQMMMEHIRAQQHDLWKMHEQSKVIVRTKEMTDHRERMQVRGTVGQFTIGI
jgi:hypothetical protein